MPVQENLYQMYRNNGLRLGYWVVRNSWGNTVARVTAIENVEDGQKLKGRYPYYGNPRVWADFYDLRTCQQVSTHSEISCPGTYAYRRVNLSPELAQALGFTPEEAGCPLPEPADIDVQIAGECAGEKTEQ